MANDHDSLGVLMEAYRGHIKPSTDVPLIRPRACHPSRGHLLLSSPRIGRKLLRNRSDRTTLTSGLFHLYERKQAMNLNLTEEQLAVRDAARDSLKTS